MKTIQLLVMAVLAFSMNTACSSQTANNEKPSEVSVSGTVEVVYFHYTRRCMTCNAVESVAKEAVEELANSQVNFTEYNLDEEKGKEKGKELGISGQALMVIGGENKINLTNEGFMNARSNPEKLKAILKEKIISVM
ncbi:MAG: hypothetical protein IH594_11605 [Bacteroidales bacterium]|nr:hypothetical protein [Bacteroidales bacterium]